MGGRAPTFDPVIGVTEVEQLRAGAPAAPEGIYLPLLPSGPGGIHRPSPRRTRSSTRNSTGYVLQPKTSGWEFSPAVADCGYRAPLVPRLARHIHARTPRRLCQFARQRLLGSNLSLAESGNALIFNMGESREDSPLWQGLVGGGPLQTSFGAGGWGKQHMRTRPRGRVCYHGCHDRR